MLRHGALRPRDPVRSSLLTCLKYTGNYTASSELFRADVIALSSHISTPSEMPHPHAHPMVHGPRQDLIIQIRRQLFGFDHLLDEVVVVASRSPYVRNSVSAVRVLRSSVRVRGEWYCIAPWSCSRRCSRSCTLYTRPSLRRHRRWRAASSRSGRSLRVWGAR